MHWASCLSAFSGVGSGSLYSLLQKQEDVERLNVIHLGGESPAGAEDSW